LNGIIAIGVSRLNPVLPRKLVYFEEFPSMSPTIYSALSKIYYEKGMKKRDWNLRAKLKSYEANYSSN
jgi:hypothetical protein